MKSYAFAEGKYEDALLMARVNLRVKSNNDFGKVKTYTCMPAIYLAGRIVLKL